MTTYRVGDPDPCPELDDIAGYCWAPHRMSDRQQSAHCVWPVGHEGDHVAVDIKRGGAVVAAVWSGNEPPKGRVWSPCDRRPWVFGPARMALDDGAWTDAMAREGAATGVNRQCSIGWHDECSDPDGDECRCACHAHEEE